MKGRRVADIIRGGGVGGYKVPYKVGWWWGRGVRLIWRSRKRRGNGLGWGGVLMCTGCAGGVKLRTWVGLVIA